MNLLKDIIVIPNLLSKQKCEEYMEYCDSKEHRKLGVFDPEETTKGDHDVPKWKQDTDYRNVSSVVEEAKGYLEWQKKYENEVLKPYLLEYVMPYYKVHISACEVPQFLKYETGGEYKVHIDSEQRYTTDEGKQIWKKLTPRDYSILFYLNDNFEGGELEFPKLSLRIQPKQGMVITFPSDHRFPHAALPVIKGKRYAIVSWCLTENTYDELPLEMKIEKFNKYIHSDSI